MRLSTWMGMCGLLITSAACGGADEHVDNASNLQTLEASESTVAVTGITRWKLRADNAGARVDGETQSGVSLLSVETTLHDRGFTLIERYHDESGTLIDQHETEFGMEGELGATQQALQAVGLSQAALTNSPTQLIQSFNGDITHSIDPSGEVLTLAGATKKTPCEKATNQFYRAQAAYLTAANALTACGFSFEPQCAAQTSSFDAAAATLEAAYAKFMSEC